MSSEWRIIQTKEFAKYYAKYPQKQRVKNIISRLLIDPYQSVNIKKLTGNLEGLYRYRFSNLRIIYKINEEKREIVLVYFGTRGDIY